MTNKEKQLLLKDISARLPYCVICHANEINLDGELLFINKVYNIVALYNDKAIGGKFDTCPIADVKPYLRSMSSMTEEEKREVREFGVCDDGAFHNDVYDVGIYMEEAFAAISWFLERHFDINYLIQKGLAIEAPEGMYKINGNNE